MSDAANDPAHEIARLQALRQLNILDTAPDATLDRITKLAAHICAAPIAMVSLTDESRQWYKSVLGADPHETPRHMALCAHAVTTDDILVVPDTTEDPRFSNNPLVVGAPYIRAYAGAPLIDADGFRLGALCVAHTTPTQLCPEQLQQLRDLAAVAMDTMTARRDSQRLALKQRLLKSITAVQRNFIAGSANGDDTFDHLLDAALSFTDSRFGVIDEVTNGLGAARHIKMRRAQHASDDDEIDVDLDDIIPLLDRTADTRDVVITHGASERHPHMTSPTPAGEPAPPIAFVGVPLISGDEFVGVLGLANCPGGYDAELVELGRPLFCSIANIILATRAKQARRIAREEMQQIGRASCRERV